MRALVLVVIAACGFPALPKLGGDGDGGDDGRSDSKSDGPLRSSCLPALATCGPVGTDDCCATSAVPGGVNFYRGYDVASDGMYPTTTFPAKLPDFRLDTYLVTVARFRAAVHAGAIWQSGAPADAAGAHAEVANSGWSSSWNSNLVTDIPMLETGFTGCQNIYATWTHDPGGHEDWPINCITWYEAFAFCIWDGGYLPTEAEMHYAQSGGDDQRAYPWSNPPSSTVISCANADVSTCAGGFPNRVGSESPMGDGRWGQADLGGNMAQWVLDSALNGGSYPLPCMNNCLDVSNSSTTRVVRGGSFYDSNGAVRSAYRRLKPPTMRDPNYGLRCARPI